jgi:hypothetical protein
MVESTNPGKHLTDAFSVCRLQEGTSVSPGDSAHSSPYHLGTVSTLSICSGEGVKVLPECTLCASVSLPQCCYEASEDNLQETSAVEQPCPADFIMLISWE